MYAKNVCNEIAKLGFRNRDVKVNSGLYVLRKTNAQAILIECCFVDDKDDIAIYNADEMAKAIVKGITGQEVVVRKSDNISDFKKWLNAYLGINLSLDDKYDSKTRRASIMAFQKYAGIDTTGYWNDECKMAAKLSKMHPRMGDSNDLVKLLQGEMLVNEIFFGKIDGVFGAYTEEVLVYFQSYWRLNNHGICGTQVWNKIYG
jgi:N-acetylmuramoyl-L-alanine amidase